MDEKNKSKEDHESSLDLEFGMSPRRPSGCRVELCLEIRLELCAWGIVSLEYKWYLKH